VKIDPTLQSDTADALSEIYTKCIEENYLEFAYQRIQFIKRILRDHRLEIVRAPENAGPKVAKGINRKVSEIANDITSKASNG